MISAKEIFLKNLETHRKLCDLLTLLEEPVNRAGELMLEAILSGGRLFFCGNGGSAADAQHLAAELSGRYLLERRALDAQALNCNSSAMTALANDYGYDSVFARQIEAHGRPGDVLIGISTSGTSCNVVKAMEAARKLAIHTVGMTGAQGRCVGELSDVLIAVPSDQTPRIQEMHILIGHSLCQFVEAGFVEQK